MVTKADALRAEIARVERELAELHRRLKQEVQPQVTKSGKRPFAELRGILKGKVNFTEEDIEAAKIRPHDDLL